MKRKTLFVMALIALSTAATATTPQKCADFNKTQYDKKVYLYGEQEHVGITINNNILKGRHDFNNERYIKCRFSPGTDPNMCIPTAYTGCTHSGVEVWPGPGDIGRVNGVHRDANQCAPLQTKSGDNFGGEEPIVHVNAGQEEVSCLTTDPNCNYTEISFDPNTFVVGWHRHLGNSGLVLMSGQSFYYDDMNNQCGYQTITANYSPITISIIPGGDFMSAFTDIPGGITWDALARNQGDAGNLDMAWTKATANFGFLYIDRTNGIDTPTHATFWPCYDAANQDGCDGKVNSLRELFGNYTTQPGDPHSTVYAPSVPNGFKALKMLDANGDGKIDNSICDPTANILCDPAYAELRVWVDTAHNGDSTQGTIYTLPQLGITSISTAFTTTSLQDANGNLLKYKGTIIQNGTPQTVYDVFFKGYDHLQ